MLGSTEECEECVVPPPVLPTGTSIGSSGSEGKGIWDLVKRGLRVLLLPLIALKRVFVWVVNKL